MKEILVKSGDKVSTGSLIMRFEIAGAAPAVAAAPAQAAPAPQASAPAAPVAATAPAGDAEVTGSSVFAYANQ
ncbi:dihydrolipoyllysine-residue acetyltransferase component of pyruvate dehydrogenase complex [Pasteurella canis]|nr:dihydrolipoyllysine-residue acetyltransferase component of pyruvate dehydrogenase complex [Pasteurella canis]